MKSIKFPLTSNTECFDSIIDYMEIVKQNILMMLLTNPGDRVIYRTMGLPIYKLLFEQGSLSDSLSLIQTALEKSINLYFPSIRIVSITDVSKQYTQDDHLFYLSIVFQDTNLGLTDNLIVSNS